MDTGNLKRAQKNAHLSSLCTPSQCSDFPSLLKAAGGRKLTSSSHTATEKKKSIKEQEFLLEVRQQESDEEFESFLANLREQPKRKLHLAEKKNT